MLLAKDKLVCGGCGWIDAVFCCDKWLFLLRNRNNQMQNDQQLNLIQLMLIKLNRRAKDCDSGVMVQQN